MADTDVVVAGVGSTVRASASNSPKGCPPTAGLATAQAVARVLATVALVTQVVKRAALVLVAVCHVVARDAADVDRVSQDVPREPATSARVVHVVARDALTVARVPATFHDVARDPVTAA